MADTYASRIRMTDLLERGAPNVLTCPVYVAGELVPPSSGTVSIYDATNTAQVAAAAVSIVAGVATYTWTPSTSLPLGERWRVVWALTWSDGTRTYRNAAALVRFAPQCPIVDQDLYGRMPALDPSRRAILRESTQSTVIDDAWVQVCNRLNADGNRINLVVSAADLRETTICLALALRFEGIPNGPPEWLERARNYRLQAKDAWPSGLQYDTDDDGQADTDRGGQPGVYLTSGGGGCLVSTLSCTELITKVESALVDAGWKLSPLTYDQLADLDYDAASGSPYGHRSFAVGLPSTLFDSPNETVLRRKADSGGLVVSDVRVRVTLQLRRDAVLPDNRDAFELERRLMVAVLTELGASAGLHLTCTGFTRRVVVADWFMSDVAFRAVHQLPLT